MLLKEFRYIPIQPYDRAGLCTSNVVSVIVGPELASTLVIFISKVHLSNSCVSKSDGNGDKLSIVASTMAPSLSSTGSTTTMCWCSGLQWESFLNCCSGNTHNDMLLAKLETVNTSSGEPGSSVFVFNTDPGLPVWSEWLVFNRVNARARKGLVLGPMRLLLRYILYLL
ncbi:uncharacterized protein LOC125855984 [Solanum stenotomum]|uniref:uncharacterized protein LOC125855984 n=1 Tax=Solanum stenotomum TaxID=172797 RepID=UPI0020D11E96|nr:uncharacterized protein LOC125855984 [Solanum stenotomum]